METPFFFKNNNYRLFGVLHEPDSFASNLKPQASGLQGLGLVFCHPFAEEKLIAHRVMVNLARRLTKEGIYCLRFDEMGHGDSDGNFEDSTIETRLSDVKCAADYLRKRTGVKKIGLLGVRLGATLAALICENVAGIDCLILISPIVDGKSYIEQCLRSNLTTQMATYKKIIKEREQLVRDLMAGDLVNIDGYLLTKALYEQIQAINFLNLSSILPKNVVIVQVSKSKGKAIDEDINRFSIKFRDGNNGTEYLMVQEDPFWKDGKVYNPRCTGVQDVIMNWLKSRYLSATD